MESHGKRYAKNEKKRMAIHMKTMWRSVETRSERD
jgi:hypothetical protein